MAALELIEPEVVLAADDPAHSLVATMTRPGTAVHSLPSIEGSLEPLTLRALRLLAATGAEQVTLVAGEAPDLPGLLLGKLHRALGSADVAVLPAAGGGLVAVARR